MIDDNYFDASLLIENNITSRISQSRFLDLTFETKIGMLLGKITEEALEDIQMSIVTIKDPSILSKVSFFYHWTEVLVFSYLKKNGRDLDSGYAAKSYLNYFCLNGFFKKEYIAEQYFVTNKLVVKFLKEAQDNKDAKEITKTYSIIVSNFMKCRGLNNTKETNFREIFKLQLQACFDLIG